jgi:hypothetical protein
MNYIKHHLHIIPAIIILAFAAVYSHFVFAATDIQGNKDTYILVGTNSQNNIISLGTLSLDPKIVSNDLKIDGTITFTEKSTGTLPASYNNLEFHFEKMTVHLSPRPCHWEQI